MSGGSAKNRVPHAIRHGALSGKAILEAGILRLERPDRLARAVIAMRRWGMTAAAGYAMNAVRFPDEPAIIDERGVISFRELHEGTNALAAALTTQGIRQGDGVAVMCRNHRGFVQAVVALAKIGADALLLNTQFAGPELSQVVRSEDPVALIYDQEFEALLGEATSGRKKFLAWVDDEGSVSAPTLDQLIGSSAGADPQPPASEGRVIILTSGTTGTPKGASRKQPKGLAPVAAILSRIPLRAREVTFIGAPLFHSWGFGHFSIGQLLASTLVLSRRFDPEGALRLIEQHEATAAPMVPVMVQRILELPEEVRANYRLSSLRCLPLSGSALPGDLANQFMDEFGEVIYNLYGSTEVAWATIAGPQDLREAPRTAGRPPIGTVVKIIGDDAREMPVGETGRIFVGNALLFEGYTRGGGKEIIDGLMSSGDVGHVDNAGRLFVEGRDDEMVVSGGENIFPQEVENVLARHHEVAEVAVIGVPDDEWGQRLKAYVVPHPGRTPNEADLMAHVKENLARFKAPREIAFLDQLPRNATGKVLKRELTRLHAAESAG